jgi:hypothetical protein
MANAAAISVPYIISGLVFIFIQMGYLIYFKGRWDGVSVLLSKIENKFYVDFLSLLITGIVMGAPFLIYVIAGVRLAAIDAFEGIYIFLVISVHSLILSIIFLKMRYWRLTLFVQEWML